MSLDNAPLKRAWITVASGELWLPRSRGTYTTIDYSRLPPLTHWSPGFGWLSDFPERDYGSGLDSDENQTGHFDRLDAELQSLGHAFPTEFKHFISQPEIQAQIPSCTACFLELSDAVTPLPGHPGCHVVRFMNDSQSCVLWYLLFRPGEPAKVLASTYFIERDIFDAMEYEAEEDVPLSYDSLLDDACICADSFEEFIYRFCIENTLWSATHENHPLAECEREYKEFARSQPATSPP